jgi:hypothetical protein
MNHAGYAAQAREVQRLIDEALERHQYAKIPELSKQLVERTRKAYDSASTVQAPKRVQRKESDR